MSRERGGDMEGVLEVQQLQQTNLNDNQQTIWLTSENREPRNTTMHKPLIWVEHLQGHMDKAKDHAELAPWTSLCIWKIRSVYPGRDHQLFGLKANCSHAAGAPGKPGSPWIRHRILKRRTNHWRDETKRNVSNDGQQIVQLILISDNFDIWQIQKMIWGGESSANNCLKKWET